MRTAPVTSLTATILPPARVEEPRRPRADVAEALDRVGEVGDLLAQVREQALGGEEQPAAGGRVAAERAAELDRLAGDHAGRVAVELRVLVDDPRHRLRVGAHVRARGCRLVGPMTSWMLLHEDAREALQLARARAASGRTAMPPLAPPYGRFTTAVFQVMSEASALTSSRSTSGW